MGVTAYTILGVEPTATHERIAAAYRAKAREHHPDHGGDARKMAKVNLAWQRLGNPVERAHYDRKLLDLAKAAAPEQAEAPSAEEDISIDAFLGRMRGGNIGVAVAEIARQHGLVDQPGFARVQMAADKAGEVSKGLVDLIGLVRGR